MSTFNAGGIVGQELGAALTQALLRVRGLGSGLGLDGAGRRADAGADPGCIPMHPGCDPYHPAPMSMCLGAGRVDLGGGRGHSP
eukprot:scaffold66704_cov30-Phaeocystis_antarctica.AAC.1